DLDSGDLALDLGKTHGVALLDVRERRRNLDGRAASVVRGESLEAEIRHVGGAETHGLAQGDLGLETLAFLLLDAERGSLDLGLEAKKVLLGLQALPVLRREELELSLQEILLALFRREQDVGAGQSVESLRHLENHV